MPRLTTPPPILDPVRDFPDLAPLARTAVRLHPRCAPDGPADASKLGGTFLWPRDEPWPAVDARHIDDLVQELLAGDIFGEGGAIPPGTPVPYAPILQLRAEDVPELPFPPGTDLVQLLWFPYLLRVPAGERAPASQFRHKVFWRRRDAVTHRRPANPVMVRRRQGTYAPPCRLHPERMAEYPNSEDLDPRLADRIDRWKAARKVDHEGDSPIDLYNWECSACPGTKVGGHVWWAQSRQVPSCPSCGAEMRHLLSVADSEWDAGTERRWQPIEERDRDEKAGRNEPGAPPHLGGFGHFYLFGCPACDGFPTRAVTQR